MSLLSLLIALTTERALTSSPWCFDYYFQRYISFFQKTVQGKSKLSLLKQANALSNSIFLLLPVALVYLLLAFIDNGLVHLIISTVILIICLGCFSIRDIYKNYLQSGLRGELTTSELYHQQLLTDKNLPQMGFGQALIWLNYRYFIAIILFFTVFGAVGAVFYRLLTTIIEQQINDTATCAESKKEGEIESETENEDNNDAENNNQTIDSSTVTDHDFYRNIIFWLDWIPVRLTSLCYMFVGHFSKALPIWLESLFDVSKPTYKVLLDVAQKSEDMTFDSEDCTAEPCLLVRLAKRSVLLVLAVIAVLTLAGVVN
ncbi:MAG: beta-lactamase regulator AmpE [Colwellia sp.]